MSQRGTARIRLMSTQHKALDKIAQQMKEIAQRTGVKIRGPIPLPTKKLVVPVRKSPCGNGTATWDKWQLRIHKRLIDIDADERTLRQIMQINVDPQVVYVEIELH
ncbi:MAG: 30S ribosomal protein S10 [Candidatus Heimdallarchaeota archaeon]